MRKKRERQIISHLNMQLVSHHTLSTNKCTRTSLESHFKHIIWLFNIAIHLLTFSKCHTLTELCERLWLSILSLPSWLTSQSISDGRFAQQQLEEHLSWLSCQKPCLSTTVSPRTWQLLHTRAAHTQLLANGDHCTPPMRSHVAYPHIHLGTFQPSCSITSYERTVLNLCSRDL